MLSDADHIEEHWPQLAALERTLDKMTDRAVSDTEVVARAEVVRTTANGPASSILDERERVMLRTARTR